MSVEIEQFKARINNDYVFSRYFGPGQSKRNVKCFSHDDSTPSMSIDSKLGLYYCHGCHISGDIIQLVMEKELVDFVKAIKLLAEWSGIEPPTKEREWSTANNNPLDISISFFKKQLSEDKTALSYLTERGLTQRTIDELGIGYAPYDHRKFAALIKSYPKLDFEPMLTDSGYPKMVGRIVFPIFSRQGQVDNFIGRSLRDEKPKYYKVLSQEHLYGINTLYKGKGPVIVVEGPMDFAAMYQNGLRSVALLGTGMVKRESISLLKAYGKKIYIALDPDEAGTMATIRAMKIMYKYGFIPFVVPLPADPDVTIRSDGPGEFSRRLESAKSGAEWISSRLKGIDAVEQFSSIIMTSPDPTIRDIERKTFSDILGINLEEVASSREATEYRQFILSSTKLYDDLYEKVMLGDAPEWIKDELINSPPPSAETSLTATHKEVEIGLKRLLHSGG